MVLSPEAKAIFERSQELFEAGDQKGLGELLWEASDEIVDELNAYTRELMSEADKS